MATALHAVFATSYYDDPISNFFIFSNGFNQGVYPRNAIPLFIIDPAMLSGSIPTAPVHAITASY